VRPHFNRKELGVVTHACFPSDGRKLKIGEFMSKLAWAKSGACLQNNEQEWLEAWLKWWSVLSSKHDAVSLNPSTTQKKKVLTFTGFF
jgi:hypothetical protein